MRTEKEETEKVSRLSSGATATIAASQGTPPSSAPTSRAKVRGREVNQQERASKVTATTVEALDIQRRIVIIRKRIKRQESKFTSQVQDILNQRYIVIIKQYQ